jgi:hypothetical protein
MLLDVNQDRAVSDVTGCRLVDCSNIPFALSLGMNSWSMKLTSKRALSFIYTPPTYSWCGA